MAEEGPPESLEELHERNRGPPTRPVAVRLPEPLLDDIDDIWEDEYTSRSEFVRRVLQYVAANPDQFGDLEVAPGERPPGRT